MGLSKAPTWQFETAVQMATYGAAQGVVADDLATVGSGTQARLYIYHGTDTAWYQYPRPGQAIGTASNGYGSTNDRIRLWTNQTTPDTGGVLSWTTSAANGDYIGVSLDCEVTVDVCFVGAFNLVAVGINIAAALSNAWGGAHRLTHTSVPSGSGCALSITAPCSSGDKIWVSSFNQGGNGGTNVDDRRFNVTLRGLR